MKSQEVLTATVQLKEVFQQSVARSTNLQLVQDMADWAGLGGVRYLPDGWELLPNSRDELNRINMQLVERLQSTDQAFSLGKIIFFKQFLLHNKNLFC